MGSRNGKPVLTDSDKAELARTSGVPDEQIADMFNNFTKNHPNGKLNKHNFKDMMSQALPQKDMSKLEKHVFRVYDTNGDGVIDFVEFMIVFHVLSEGSPEQVLRKIFRVFDVNSDGSISIKEMQRLVADLYGLMEHRDPHQASRELIATTAFREMDTNDDGQVTGDEFVAAVLAKEELSKKLTLQIMEIFSD